MVVVKRQPQPSDIQGIREAVKAHIQENGQDEFEASDVKRVFGEDDYVARFFRHVQERSGDQVATAASMITNTLKWRKETGIGRLTSADLDPEIRDRCELYSHNRDIDGKKLLVFDVKKHTKGKNMDANKKVFLYWMERLEREEQGGKITQFFDCDGAGLANMDIEFMRFQISVMEQYIPDKLNYILVFNMPFILNAGFQIIKKMLPTEAQEMIKFVKKSNNEYVAEDQRLVPWGGTDDWQPHFEEEVPPARTAYPPLPLPHNGGGSSASLSIPYENDDMKKRAVHFLPEANGPSSPSREKSRSKKQRDNGDISRASSFNESSTSRSSGKPLLGLNPLDEVVFNRNEQDELMGVVSATNITSFPVALKIKTTSPDKYRVRPSTACLEAGQVCSIEIYVQTDGQLGPTVSLVRDKFLITAVTVDQPNLNNQQIAEVMKTNKPDASYRLRCVLAAAVDNVQKQTISYQESGRPMGDGARAMSMMGSSRQDEQLEKMSRQVAKMASNQEELQAQVSFAKTLLIVLLALMVLTFFLVFWRTHNLAPVCSVTPNDSYSTLDSPKEL